MASSGADRVSTTMRLRPYPASSGAERVSLVMRHLRPDVGSDALALGGSRPCACAADAAESMVKDRRMADIGRQEMMVAEHEMPGLMATRAEYGPAKPFSGMRITGSLHMTVPTGVLIETLHALGAKVRWASCNSYGTQDHAAAAIAEAGTAAVFAWKSDTLPEYWWCTEKALTWADADGPDQIMDDGSDATLLIHKGVAFEEEFATYGTLPDPTSTTNPEFKCMLELLKNSIQADNTKWTRMAAHCKGVSEETTTGVHRLKDMAKKHELLFPVINVNACVSKSKFDSVYGVRHSLPDGIMRATDVKIGGKLCLVCGFGDIGKGCAASLRGFGAQVVISEIDPVCALQACMEGYRVVTLEDVVGEIDIFATTSKYNKIIRPEHMMKMKNNAIVSNIFDNEIDIEGMEGVMSENIKPQVDRLVFPDGHGVIVLAAGLLMNMGCATGSEGYLNQSFVMSNSFTNQVLAQVALVDNWKKTRAFKRDVYPLPKELDEKVASLHLPALGAKLTKLEKKPANIFMAPAP